MAGFAVEDMFLKVAGAELPPGQILLAFGAGGALIFSILARSSGQSLTPSAVFERTMLVRNAFEIIGRLFYTLAFLLTPLSSTTIILQAAPIVVVAGAALFLGEAVGWRRWLAIGIGLFGVLIVVQPGTESFSALSILAVIGMFGFAGRDLATRAAPPSLGGWVLGVWGFLMIVLAGALFSLWDGSPFVSPTPNTLLAVIGGIVFGVIGYSCLTQAMRTGDVSAVTPFRYTRLLFGIALGVIVFGETLSTATVIGSLIVVASGLFIMWRGRD